MKALITGVTGFVGSYLCRKLLDVGYEVVGLARSIESDIDDIKMISCDVTDEPLLRNVLMTEKPDQIYHLAGSAFVPISIKEPRQTYNTIVNGTLSLYEALRGLDIAPKVLFVGSAAVYGEGSGVPFKESDLMKPVNPYAGAKACADLISEQYINNYQMNIVRVRPFNHTGPRQSPVFVCSSFAKQLAEIESGVRSELIVGNLNVKRDFLDVRDVVEAYFMLMEKGVSGEVYNVSSQQAVSVSHLLDLLTQHSKVKSLEIKIDPNKLRDNETPVKLGDSSKIREELGWEPAYKIEQTMSDLLDYWRVSIREDFGWIRL
ncbi:GDP-mannose 4,6-dehydratase [Paenibacillus barengoltzii]|uniref:GDP-mannose 4,6-dehydratase n=1 Tax=Paenibacillus barengoltzii TaxID=343517 RepID=UPI002DBF8B13|nr:GDP-mannose 4,6-dehydratase [Paenibacillus barengoltzii]MEC2346212.1 GDP-mannose 4,6-dehydratase [Paenibacillus barengoltzii]